MRNEEQSDDVPAEMGELVSRAESRSDYCAAIAFYHARFVAIHPFMDGNCRVGRAILEAQANLLGMPINLTPIDENKRQYLEACNEAISSNDTAPLARMIGKCVGHTFEHSTALMSDVSIRSRRMQHLDDVKSLAEERTVARLSDVPPLPSARLDAERSDFVEKLDELQARFRAAPAALREAIVNETRAFVSALPGTDLTRIPLRVAAAEFVSGRESESDVQRVEGRFAEHQQALARCPARPVSKALGFTR